MFTLVFLVFCSSKQSLRGTQEAQSPLLNSWEVLGRAVPFEDQGFRKFFLCFCNFFKICKVLFQ